MSLQLKAYREQAHLSQDDVANAIMVSRQAVSRWETNKTYPDIDNLMSLSKLYGISLDELLSESPKIKRKLALDAKQPQKKSTKFINRKTYNANDESFELITITLLSAILPVFGVFIPPYIIFRNNKFNRYFILIYIIAMIVFLVSLFNCYLFLSDIFTHSSTEIHLD